jgi:hypothetical protein
VLSPGPPWLSGGFPRQDLLGNLRPLPYARALSKVRQVSLGGIMPP